MRASAISSTDLLFAHSIQCEKKGVFFGYFLCTSKESDPRYSIAEALAPKPKNQTLDPSRWNAEQKSSDFGAAKQPPRQRPNPIKQRGRQLVERRRRMTLARRRSGIAPCRLRILLELPITPDRRIDTEPARPHPHRFQQHAID